VDDLLPFSLAPSLHHHDCGQSDLWGPEVQELNLFVKGRRVDSDRGQDRSTHHGLRRVHRNCSIGQGTDLTGRTISLDAPRYKLNFGAREILHEGVSYQCL
jgi:hypothetical protein